MSNISTSHPSYDDFKEVVEGKNTRAFSSRQLITLSSQGSSVTTSDLVQLSLIEERDHLGTILKLPGLLLFPFLALVATKMNFGQTRCTRSTVQYNNGLR